MAKSLRSKWKRKMRAVKRERYGEKELKRLNEMLEKAGDVQFRAEVKEEEEEEQAMDTVIDSTEVQLIPPPPTAARKNRVDRRVRGTDRRSRKESSQSHSTNNDGDGDEEMSPLKVTRTFSRRTMRDQFGNYPDWMGKRKMRTQQKKNKRLKRGRSAMATRGK